MTAAELVAAARAAGCVLHLEDGHVHYRAPNTPAAAVLLLELRTRRLEVAALLGAEAARAALLAGTETAGDAERRALLEAAAARGYVRLPLQPAVAVVGGREMWERFAANGTAEDVAAAREALGP